MYKCTKTSFDPFIPTSLLASISTKGPVCEGKSIPSEASNLPPGMGEEPITLTHSYKFSHRRPLYCRKSTNSQFVSKTLNPISGTVGDCFPNPSLVDATGSGTVAYIKFIQSLKTL